VPTVAPAADETIATETTPAGTGAGVPWRWIALGSLGLWLATMLAWWWRRRRTGEASSPRALAPASDRQLRAAFLAAARGADADAQARALLAWARAERPALAHLGAVADALASGPQQVAIEALQRRLYGVEAAPIPGDRLAEAFREGFQWRATGAPPPGDSNLPPLYPFKLE
jgi:hypothetical protein